ncbi:CAF17-like 4Fe-4S cluster assembly/insertion protein YgfZ [Methylovulum psychrotolerans]|jgi:hypothetical protein|uniref:Folate-binding protein n=1 Tax=Methylovulum psychrotolerans TaxID=1704499 RepID=A0A1Z4BZT8_9GAMM|nr:folate-binding protein YgfZ [Methylovulum psychrotolerans]ASF46771.1 folate-binding protein YgfZ [Methylovulum psychrotolerans]POZ50768.1 folate-binding protein [Methylovulum psychrotolerans]
MNPIWQNFLHSAHAEFTATDITFPIRSQGRQCLYPLAHFGILTVGGKDAATLLQGQITCNINDLSETQSSLAAICNPKGRAIATFLIVRQAEVFHLIVPLALLDTLKKRLSLFVLRSSVTFTDNTDHYALLGADTEEAAPWLATRQADEVCQIQLDNRVLILAAPEAAIACWTAYTGQGYQASPSAHWRLRDLYCGLPWLSPATSEAFVPQMFHLDKLGGISFKKGCYTGQEIIARTHYLGKSKRGMLLAESHGNLPEPNSAVLNSAGETVGQVLAAQADGAVCKLLVVVQLSETGVYPLTLADGRLMAVMPSDGMAWRV